METEKFIEKPVSLSEKKLIANDLARLFVKIRFDKADIAFVIIVLILFVTGVRNSVIFISVTAGFVFVFCSLMTRLELIQEFKSRHKLVGTFKIIHKRYFRKHVFETKNTYIVVPKSIYEQVTLGDVVQIEKLPNGRILSCRKLLSSTTRNP
jgi:hypothetical protein